MSHRLDYDDAWSAAESAELYGVPRWSNGYFHVNAAGDLCVAPGGSDNGRSVAFKEIISGLHERGVDMPVLLRFEDILEASIESINGAFKQAISEYGYGNVYRGVYPIKVNQQEQVVEKICAFGSRYHHGLEAGSKAELIAAISFLRDPDAYLICNGYKDEEFVELTLRANQMGVRGVLVVETPNELELILEQSKRLGVRPVLGVRMKLSAQAGGRWTESGGDNSLFGLTVAQLMGVVDRLRDEDMLDALVLLHYHLGSQIPNIRDIRAAVGEAARIYTGLVHEGAAMGVLDLGGGLAVDYDGSHSDFACSCNYGVNEYCVDIIEGIMGVLDEAEVAHPVLITESGRAVVSYHSVLLFNVLDVSRFESSVEEVAPNTQAHEHLQHLCNIPALLVADNLQECYHDAVFYRDELRTLFKLGAISLRERATAERYFWHIMIKALALAETLPFVPDEFVDLAPRLADVYYGNFSVFQSLPDAWAIDQIFPVMPVHRLDEKPERRAIIADITCDCDGKLSRFADRRDVARTLPLHELRDRDEYYLGVFLVGAYQETLGDLHNLLGDTNVVNLQIDGEGRVHYEREIEGDSVADVLSYVEYDPRSVMRRIKEMAEHAVRHGMMSVAARRDAVRAFEDGMRGYTYFER